LMPVGIQQADFYTSLPTPAHHDYYSSAACSPYTWRYSCISDVVGRRFNGRYDVSTMKPCSHVSFEVESLETTLSPWYWGNSGSYRCLVSGAASIPEALSVLFRSDLVPTDVEARRLDLGYGLINRLIARRYGMKSERSHFKRWQSVKPTMTTRANMAVFLAELRDVKRMFDIIPPKHFRVKNWKEVLKYGNSQHLNYNFGWKPFIKDVKEVFKGMDSFETRLKKFVDGADKDLTSHASDQDTSGVDNFYITNPHYSNWRLEVESTYTVRASSTFNYKYDLPYSAEGLKWRAYLDSLGLHASPANIWAILPWSFVVDWFAPVGDYLHNLDSDWAEPYINMIQACYSRSLQIQATWYVKNLGPYTGNSRAPFAVTRFKSYDRLLGLPEWEACQPELDADKIRLLSSLVAGRIL